eukprot:COSAG01_NODE_43658_length_427_cov_1.731707_2_plen_38_part_01
MLTRRRVAGITCVLASAQRDAATVGRRVGQNGGLAIIR